MTNTEFQTQKNLARQLDQCAARAEAIDRDPATSKQCWYLASLVLASGEDGGEFFTNTSYVLTKARASSLIETYKN